MNIGNTILKGVTVSVNDVASLTCKKGAKSAAYAVVWSTGNAFASSGDISLLEQVVCQGTFQFTQAVLDTEQAAKVFTPTATTTCSATADNTALPVDDHAATVSISNGAAASLVVNIVTSACTLPSIIPDGQPSKKISGCGGRLMLMLGL